MATDVESPVKERSVPKPVFTDAEAGAREFPSSTSRSYNYFTPAKRRASIYEDVTVDVQPDPARHLLQGWIYAFADGTAGYPEEWTALKSSNWHAFLDPNEEWEQTIYRNNANVVRQIGHNLANAKAARAFDGWNRGWTSVVEKHVSAWAHAEHGIGMHVYLPAQRDAPTNMINNATVGRLGAQAPLRPGSDPVQPRAHRPDRGLRRQRPQAGVGGGSGLAGRTRERRAADRDPRLGGGVLRRHGRVRAARRRAVPQRVRDAGRGAAGRLRDPDADRLRRVRRRARPARVTARSSGCSPTTSSSARRTGRRCSHGSTPGRRSASDAARTMQPIWSQPGEKVIRFEDSFEHAERRHAEVVGELNLNVTEVNA